MAWELFPRPRTKKEKKRAILEENMRKGKAAEEQFDWEQAMRGNEVKKISKGGDRIVTPVSPLGRKGKPVRVDVKSSATAKLSPLQRKKRARKVVVEPLFY